MRWSLSQKQSRSVGRREAIRRLGLAATAVGTGALGACFGDSGAARAGEERISRADPGPLGPLGMQLYGLGQYVQNDMERALRDVADIGYREVEFAGYFGYQPRQVRNFLSAAGLSAPSALVSIDEVIESWFPTLRVAAEIGHRWLVVAWLPEEMRSSLEAWRNTADFFNRAAEEAAVAGIRLGYHTRDADFVPMEGRVPLDVLCEETDPALVDIELDVYWALQAGGDPLAFLDRWPGRVPLIHVNDRGPGAQMVPVGSGDIDWGAVFERRFRFGMQHAFVDHEEAADPYAMATASFEYLNTLDI